MNKQVLTTNDVTIKQVEVSIKVLKIGNKQVTLAVFRQLPEEQIIDYDTGTFLGQPWGRVNYHPDSECQKMPAHFHVVWEKEGKLYRAAILNRWSLPMLPDDVEYGGRNPLTVLHWAIEMYLYARLVEGWLPEKIIGKRSHVDVQINGGSFQYPFDDAPTFLSDVLGKMRDYAKRRQTYEYEEKQYQEKPSDSYYSSIIVRERECFQEATGEIEALRMRVLGHLEEHKVPTSSGAIYQDCLVPAMNAFIQFRKTWQQSYNQLRQLEQLFIAV
jgi:hypothetical protein